MKKKLFLFALLFSSLLTACLSDDDDGEKWDAAKVCPETGTNAYGMPNRGTFTDERDGEVYHYTTIGDQVWMAENLRFALPYPYSFCYGTELCYLRRLWETDVGETVCFKDTASLNEIAERMQLSCADNDCIAAEYCKKFGRYYSLKDREADTWLLNRDVVDSVCPKGWHLPSKGEWEILIDKTEGDLSRLLSDEEYLFKENDKLTKVYGSERNLCGFSTLYAGHVSSPKVMSVFLAADFWTSTAAGPLHVNEVGFTREILFTTDKEFISIRCLKD